MLHVSAVPKSDRVSIASTSVCWSIYCRFTSLIFSSCRLCSHYHARSFSHSLILPAFCRRICACVCVCVCVSICINFMCPWAHSPHVYVFVCMRMFSIKTLHSYHCRLLFVCMCVWLRLCSWNGFVCLRLQFSWYVFFLSSLATFNKWEWSSEIQSIICKCKWRVFKKKKHFLHSTKTKKRRNNSYRNVV